MTQSTLFNGGLHGATAAHLIKENEGAIYFNVDHVPGNLTPMYEKIREIEGALEWGHKFTTNNEWYFFDHPRDFVEYQERLYIGNRTGRSTKVVNNETHYLGLIPPFGNPRLAATNTSLSNLTDIELYCVSGLDFGLRQTQQAAVLGDIPTETDLEYRIINENASGELSEGTYKEINTGSLFLVSCWITITDPKWLNDVSVYRKWTDDEWHLVETLAFDPALAEQPAIIDSVYDISAQPILDEGTLGPVGNLNGVLQYAYTFYNSVDGTESVPMFVTPEIATVSGIVEMTNIQVGTDPQVDKKRIYRIGGNITAFHLVAEIDNADTSFTDNVADLDLTGELLDSGTNYPPPDTGMSWLTEYNSMLFASDGDKLIFTPIGEPNYWPETYYLDFPRNITGIGRTPIGLLVFNVFETWLVTGTGPLSLSQQLLSASQGCPNGDTVVSIEGASFWVSRDGICGSDGGRVKVLTRPKMGKMNLSNSINAKIHDSTYYLQMGDIEDPNNTVCWIYDLEREVIKTAAFKIKTLLTADDKIYGFKSLGLSHLEGNRDFKMEMWYVSPVYIGRGYTVPKVYKNIFIQSEGQVNVGILIDNVLITTVELDTDKDNHQLKVPIEEMRGFGIQFSVTGFGNVYEIRWDDGDANQ